MNEVKRYEIGGLTYEQRELVLGQWKQLSPLLADLALPPGVTALAGLLQALEQSGKLEKTLAVVLTEEGTQLKDKDLDAVAAALEFSITPQQIAQVIEDFFTCNPTASVLSRLGDVLVMIVQIIGDAMREIGSRRSASCSAAETTAAAMPSCGEPPLAAPSPGSLTANAS